MKTWKRRWFILTDSCLYYFEYTTVRICLPATTPPPLVVGCVFNIHLLLQDQDPIGIIPLENLSVRKLQDTSRPVRTHLFLI